MQPEFDCVFKYRLKFIQLLNPQNLLYYLASNIYCYEVLTLIYCELKQNQSNYSS